MPLRVPYSEFKAYMAERKDSYAVVETGDSVTVTFNGSSPTVVEKLGEPVTVTISARREGDMVLFISMHVAVGEKVYEASVSSLESWLVEVTGRI